MKKTILKYAKKIGFTIKRCQKNGLPIDFSPKESALVEKVANYTMTREERIVALQRGVRKAIDDYFEEVGNGPMITRVDASGAIAIK
ncbi:hypothetical protein N9972_00450 [bacterium]|nr:hypothetical protein [bacterium]